MPRINGSLVADLPQGPDSSSPGSFCTEHKASRRKAARPADMTEILLFSTFQLIRMFTETSRLLNSSNILELPRKSVQTCSIWRRPRST